MRRNGFSLVEVLVALTVLLGGLAMMTHVLLAAGLLNRDARSLASASALAAQKIEELRAIPVGDPELAPSARSTLDEDVSGYFDETDGYVRRWSITVLPAGPPSALLFQVVVFPASAGRRPIATLRGVVRFVAVRRGVPP